MKNSQLEFSLERIENTITFNPTWKNGTGYLDGAVEAQLAVGEAVKCVDDYGRRVILIGTRFGTCVFFERTVYEEGQEDVTMVNNVPTKLRMMITDGPLSDSEFARLVGFKGYNIGHHLERLFA